ncbi:hypothetical protein [Mesorhizobium ciceri]|uniref:hypothetical protein n=1 Tax=Mesorhizobium TaxID=68287 RepID=UPI0018CC53D7|nr:hypothetical protein [Mesorhizobium ciceri]
MRKELANIVRDRYAAATNKDKRRILEEFIAATGYHEKSAIRVLNSSSELKVWRSEQADALLFGPLNKEPPILEIAGPH